MTTIAGAVGATLDQAGELDAAIGNVRLHVERHLPFVVLYRQPAGCDDPGTRSFVEGEASYITVVSPTDDADGSDDLAELIDTIARVERSRFGSFLVVEVWSELVAGTSPEFRIVAPTHGAPAAMLESLESALLAVQVEDRGTAVRVEYLDRWSPPGLTPIEAGEACCHVGIAVPALHHDLGSGVLLPAVHRELRREFLRALRRGLYEFTHSHTPLQPAHFHELGPRALTDDVYEVDREVAAISASFDLVLHVTPVNTPEALHDFRSADGEVTPEFLYRARTLDPDEVKRRLFNIPLETIEDPAMLHIFLEKRDELDRKLTLITDRNTDRFLHGSRALYGDPDNTLLAAAQHIVGAIDTRPSAEPLPIDEVVAFAQAELDHYRTLDPTLRSTVELRHDLPGVMVSQGDLLIGATSRVPRARLVPLMAHEIGTHVLTHHNGRQQPFRELYVGTAGYEALQEGLAVLWEYLVGGLDAGRLRLLAGRVLAANAMCDGADFVSTHRELTTRWGFGFSEAFSITTRVHRGGGFIKDVVYLRGLMQVVDYLSEGEPFERLHMGKVAHEHLGIVEELEWRQVLDPPRLLPRHFGDPDVQHRIEECRRGLAIDDLIRSTR